MLSQIFLGFSLVGAEWVLYLLILLSILSVTLMFERARFLSQAQRGLIEFRAKLRAAALAGRWDEAKQLAASRLGTQPVGSPRDLETAMAVALLERGQASSDVLSEVAQDSVILGRISFERNLTVLATIGNNAPFIGLFGTVLGIIKAFYDLSKAGAGMNTVSTGISEALVATAVGILVAIPAVAAFNLFQRRVKSAIAEAESLKSFLIGRLAN